jgi:hypothetical protein
MFRKALANTRSKAVGTINRSQAVISRHDPPALRTGRSGVIDPPFLVSSGGVTWFFILRCYAWVCCWFC